MGLDEIVRRFEAAGIKCKRQSDGSYRCQCPAHAGDPLPKRGTHLSLAVGQKGGVVVTCHSHHCGLEEVARAVGLEPEDFMPAPTNGARQPENLYPYRDENGTELFFVARFPGKEFRQFQKDAQGQTIWNLTGIRRVLFGLPELLKTAPGELVGICEGEKDAIALSALGVMATTNPGGAGKWRQEYTDWLKQRLPDQKFVILPDNDDTGRKHALEVSESLKSAGLTCQIVNLPDVPPKGDVSDWISKGGTREEFLRLTEPAPHPLDLRVMDGRALEKAELPLPEALIPHLLYRGFSTLIAGDSKLGKSSLQLRAILAGACGGWWLDKERRSENRLPRSRILFVNFEDPLFVTRERAQKMMAPEGLPEDFLTMEPPYGYTLRQVLDWIHGSWQKLGLDAVVLDPIGVAAEWDDETDNAEVTRTFKQIQQLAAETHLAVLTAHHVTKKPGQHGLNIRGASAIKANVLGYLVLEREKELFRLAGVNKLSGVWDVLLDRTDQDWSWWIVETRAGHTRTQQQMVKERAKVDLLAHIKAEPMITTDRLAELIEVPRRTCLDYLHELYEAGYVKAVGMPAGKKGGRPADGWVRMPSEEVLGFGE